MIAMSKDELVSFLSQGTRTAKLATVKENGSPHVVPFSCLTMNAIYNFWNGD